MLDLRFYSSGYDGLYKNHPGRPKRHWDRIRCRNKWSVHDIVRTENTLDPYWGRFACIRSQTCVMAKRPSSDRSTPQPPNDLHTRTGKDVFHVWSLFQFRRQVLTRKVQVFMQVATPFGTIGHIINDSTIGNEFSRAAFTRIAAQLQNGDDSVRDIHVNYQ